MRSKDGMANFVGMLMYFINPMEVNAFMSSFASYLYDAVTDNRIEDPHKALLLIKNSQLYENYVKINSFVQKLYDNDSSIEPTLVHYICKEYNKIYGKNYTEAKIKKTIYRRVSDVRRNATDSSFRRLKIINRL